MQTFVQQLTDSVYSSTTHKLHSDGDALIHLNNGLHGKNASAVYTTDGSIIKVSYHHNMSRRAIAEILAAHPSIVADVTSLSARITRHTAQKTKLSQQLMALALHCRAIAHAEMIGPAHIMRNILPDCAVAFSDMLHDIPRTAPQDKYVLSMVLQRQLQAVTVVMQKELFARMVG